MTSYLRLLKMLLDCGRKKDDRTNIGTLSLFGAQERFDLTEGFPLLTTKKLHLRSIIYELLWFLQGDTNIKYLQANGVSIWNEWADAHGDLGPIYGAQWRRWRTPEGKEIDQLAGLIANLKLNPNSRRHIVSAWNPSEIEMMAVAPCHALMQFYANDGELSCQVYQRSADIFLGVPFNIASYALLTMIIAQLTGLKPKELIHTFGDLHLYMNHIEQAHEQLSREPRALPRMRLNPKITQLQDFRYEDFILEGYDPHPPISAPVAV